MHLINPISILIFIQWLQYGKVYEIFALIDIRFAIAQYGYVSVFFVDHLIPRT